VIEYRGIGVGVKRELSMSEIKTEYYLSTPFNMLRDRISFLTANGFNPEVRMADSDFLSAISDGEVEDFRKLLDSNSLSCFTHGPFFGLDVASLDPTISEYSVDILTRGLEVSSALGAGVMVIHTGFLPQFSRYGRKLWYANWSERMCPLVQIANRLGVSLALENTWDHRPEIMEWLLRPLPVGGVGICIDTGHLNVYSQAPVKRWWELLGDRVMVVHIHDNDGLSDDHLVPGEGTFDFGEFIELMCGSTELPIMDFEISPSHAGKGRDFIGKILSERCRRTDVRE
jgi:sugar phosphate isomerase/epimerase